MRAILSLAICVSQMSVVINRCDAASEHEMSVGAQREQLCAPTSLKAVGKFLELESFRLPPSGYSSDAEAIISSAACKTNPANKNITIAAIAYESGRKEIKGLIVALIDNSKGRVISSHQEEIEEDAGLKLESGSLWIDTAPYTLATGVRAFGVDITSGYIPHCGDGGSGARRTLYVQEGRRFRPVLTDLTMSYWSFIQQAQSRCVYGDDAPEVTIIENTRLSIGVDTESTKGYRNLIVTAVRSRDDGKATEKAPFSFKLHYDGRQYPTKKLSDRLGQWDR